MRKNLCSVSVAICVVATASHGQGQTAVVAQELAARVHIPAATAGRVTADTTQMHVAGMRRSGAGDPALPGDAWHVGSLTKSMTATLAARLVDGGRIRWDSTIGEVLGTAYPDMHPDWRDTPLSALLTHLSGMEPNLSRVATLILRNGSRRAYVERMLARPPTETPGTFVYSNAGYVVAGAMLEAAGRASWEELMQAEVFGPLGMESAGFGPPQGDAIEGHGTGLFGGVNPAGQGFGADNIPAMGPAGRVHLNTEDMLDYLRAHLLRDEAFLTPEAWQTLHAPAGPRGYGMGWAVGDDGSLVHSGSNTLWYARALVDVVAGEAVFVAVNSGNLDRVAEPVDTALRTVLQGP